MYDASLLPYVSVQQERNIIILARLQPLHLAFVPLRPQHIHNHLPLFLVPFSPYPPKTEFEFYSHPLLKPSLSSYAICRPEAWLQFSPFFLHYTRASRTQAAARAASQVSYQPTWQLDPPPPGLLPLALQPLASFPAASCVLLLVRYLLATALEGEPWGLPVNAAAEVAAAGVAAGGEGQLQQMQQVPQQQQGRQWSDAIRSMRAGHALGLAMLAADPQSLAEVVGREARGDGQPLVREDALLCILHLLALGLHHLKQQLQQLPGSVPAGHADSAGEEARRKLLSEALGHLTGPRHAQRSYQARSAASWGGEAQAGLGLGLELGPGGSGRVVGGGSGAGVGMGAPRMPGIMTSLAGLLREAPADAWGGEAAPSPAPSLVGHEVAACCRAALQLAQEVLALAPDSGSGGEDHVRGEAREAAAGEARAGAAAAVSAAGGAKDRRSAARAAQAALQQQLLAQQAAFMRRSAAGDEEDEDEEEEGIVSGGVAGGWSPVPSSSRPGSAAPSGGEEAMQVDNVGAATAVLQPPAGQDCVDQQQQQETATLVVSRLQQMRGECVLCHGGAGGAGAGAGGGTGAGGPLGLLCHVKVCGTLGTALS